MIENIENGTTITLKQPLQYRHLGKTYKAGDWTYSMRAEVGLLSSNIRIIGKACLGSNFIMVTTEQKSG